MATNASVTCGCRPGKWSGTNCSLRYGDTLVYAHGLTLYEVMDLLVDYYLIGDDDA